MQVKHMSIRKHLELSQITAVGNAIGNAQLLSAMYLESNRFWNMANDAMSGNHLIMGVVLNNEGKSSAIMDYALQISNMFIESKHPTLSLFSKRAFSLATEHRKSILYRMAAGRYNTNEELFKTVVTELLCFDPFVTEIAIFGVQSEHTSRLLARFIAAMLGDFVSEDDWNVTHEELAEVLSSIDFESRREDFINVCLELSLNTETVFDFYQLVEQARNELIK